MSKESYCVIKTSSRAWGGILSILLAVGGAITATYVLKYLAGRSDTGNLTGYQGRGGVIWQRR